MNRKQFMESRGASCKNWSWSWSFSNENEKYIIFGAWTHHFEGDRCLILDDGWEHDEAGKRKNAYGESLENILRVYRGEYRLMTFPMVIAKADPTDSGSAKIDHIVPELTLRSLIRDGTGWYAVSYTQELQIPEELPEQEYEEGSSSKITVNAYERNKEARNACLAHYGPVCAVCGFEARKHYGEIACGLIHVHHLSQISKKMGITYKIDPIKDLRPVCPNCHAVIHYSSPMLSIEEAKMHWLRSKNT